jgi:pimeloyl-ACP methyl ester carboxylesterase
MADSKAELTGRSGPPVYLLHGLLETAIGHFGPQIQAWGDATRIIPVDLPGHGRCPIDARPGYYTVAGEYVLALIKRFGPGHVVAASFLGGPVAVQCALNHPDLFSSLVLTGFVPDVPQPLLRAWLRGFELAAQHSEELVGAYQRVHGARWAKTLAAVVAEVDQAYSDRVLVTTGMLAALRPRTLLLNGANKANERTAACELPASCPGLRGVVIENAGHIPGRDQPAEFNRIVERFWEEISAGAVVH